MIEYDGGRGLLECGGCGKRGVHERSVDGSLVVGCRYCRRERRGRVGQEFALDAHDRAQSLREIPAPS